MPKASKGARRGRLVRMFDDDRTCDHRFGAVEQAPRPRDQRLRRSRRTCTFCDAVEVTISGPTRALDQLPPEDADVMFSTAAYAQRRYA